MPGAAPCFNEAEAIKPRNHSALLHNPILPFSRFNEAEAIKPRNLPAAELEWPALCQLQ